MGDRPSRSLKPLAAGLALALAACAVAANGETSGPDGLMAWPDLLERPRPQPTATIRYGDDPLQVVDLWLPEGAGPHPVVLMVHGGCWQTEIADRTIMNWIADDLRRRGIAVWNIDYRGVDRPGGGYPGTFHDAAAAADALRDHAARYRSRPLARRRDRPFAPAAISRSGWRRGRACRAARRCAPPIRCRSHAVISLGGLPDLEEAARPGTAAAPK